MKNSYRIFPICAAISFVTIAIIALAIGGCEKMIETASGGQTPMKCHWSFVALPFIAALGAFSSLFTLGCDTKRSKQLLGALSILTCGVIAAIPSPVGIGLCTNTSMGCHGTYHITLGVVAVASLFSILTITKARDNSDDQLDIPKAHF